jgi:hypothetical protein
MRRLASMVAIVAALGSVTFAQGNNTQIVLTAAQVKDRILVAPALTDGDTVVELTLDNRSSPEPRAPDSTFVASQSIAVAYTDPNPFRVALSAGIEEADDPSHVALMKLIDTLLAVGPIVNPLPALNRNAPNLDTEKRALFSRSGLPIPSNAVTSTCASAETAFSTLSGLNSDLYPTEASTQGLSSSLGAWRATLDAFPTGVRAGLTTPTTGVIALIRAHAEMIDGHLKAALTAIAVVEAEVTKAPGGTDCERLTHALYSLAAMTQPRRRIGELQKIVKSLTDLAPALEDFADARRWIPPGYRDFRITTVHPNEAKIQRVTVKITQLQYAAPDPGTGIVATKGDPASRTFNVRQYDSVIFELGVGAISAKVVSPKYGTVERDGQTFAEKIGEDEWSFDPAVVGNFVSRWGRSRFAALMFQVGALADKEKPALIVGGGLRLFGSPKGGIGISGGLVRAWVNEIPQAQLAIPITGTKDIEDRKERVWKNAGYFMFQYQF